MFICIRSGRLARKRFVQQTAKIHSHEKETVCFLPGRVGCTNNFDLPRGTNLIRISLPRLWLPLFKSGFFRRKFGFEQLSERPGLSTTITKSIRLDKMPETLYYYWIYWSQNQYRWFRESAVLIAITVHSGNKHFIIIEYELHITDILEYGEARSHRNFH